MNIPVSCSYIKRKDMDSVLNCLMTDSIGPGDFLEKFIKLARDVMGFEYGFALRSLVTALELAIDTLGLEEGSTIALPALSPSYYLSVLKSRKMIPAFLDHDPGTGIVDLGGLNDIYPKPCALILYEALGIMPSPESFESLGIPIIEDISTSFGARSDDAFAGSIGRISFMGLEQGSLIPSGGGALVFSHHRRDALALKNAFETIPQESLMTDYNAALGYSQLKDIETAKRKRCELFSLFAQSLAGTRHLPFMQSGNGQQACWSFPVSIASGMKDIRLYAKRKEVDTEAAFDMSVLAMQDFPEDICPNARSLMMRTVLFPLHQRIGSSEATKIMRVLSSLP
jgi:dTDP-4-amino-4,6-dideoxygalactose transaminase